MAIFYVKIMRNNCVDVSVYGERNYRLFLDIIKQELDSFNHTDITAIQAFLLMNIGENVVTIGEVISRGYYIGSNASYNVKKLINNGYIQQVPSEYDRRTVYLKLTEKGLELCGEIDDSIKCHMNLFENKLKGKFDMNTGIEFLKNVERVWKDLLQNRI